MYHKQLAKKTSPSLRSTPISKWMQLEKAIGTRAKNEILAGKPTPWVPEFQGISAQLGGDSGQEKAPIQTKGIKAEKQRSPLPIEHLQQHPVTEKPSAAEGDRPSCRLCFTHNLGED